MKERMQSVWLSGTDTADELIGVLMAISVVSKRLAKKLTLMEQANERSGKADGSKETVPTHAG